MLRNGVREGFVLQVQHEADEADGVANMLLCRVAKMGQHCLWISSILILTACCSPPAPGGRWHPFPQGTRLLAARPTTHCSSKHPWVLQVWRVLPEVAWALHAGAVQEVPLSPRDPHQPLCLTQG